MADRSDTLETVLLALELLRRIPRDRKVTARQLHEQLQNTRSKRDLRTIQRQLDMLNNRYCWKNFARNRCLYSSPSVAPCLYSARVGSCGMISNASFRDRATETHRRHLVPRDRQSTLNLK